MAFASAEELADWFGVTLSEVEEGRADALLALATNLIQQEVEQTVEKVASDELLRRGTGADRVRLPERPVISVASVTLGGTVVAPTEWYVDGDELVRIAGGWGSPEEVLKIVYSHGYDTVPAAIKAVCLAMVGRVWVNPGMTTEEQEGEARTVYSTRGDVGLMLTDRERQFVRSVIGGASSVGSVALR